MTQPHSDSGQSAKGQPPRSTGKTAVWLGSPFFWVALGLILVFIPDPDAPKFAYHRLDDLLYGAVVAGFLAWRFGWKGLPVSSPLFAFAYLVLGWIFGMTYELSLTVDGSGVGGVHPDTYTSFVLAQGDYVLLLLLCLAALRLFTLDARGFFFFSFGISLTEGLIFTGIVWSVAASAQALLVPVFVGYYALSYASFLVLPVLLVSPAKFHRSARRSPSVPLLVIAGFAAGFVARLIWAMGYAPAAHALFNLVPPSD